MRLPSWSILTLAAALMIGAGAISVARAAEANITVTGKVVDKDGAAVADADVSLAKPRQQGETGRPTPLATAKTDKDGKFELKAEKVADGEYNVYARAKDKGFGRAQVKVAEGKVDPADVSIKLGDRPARGGGNGGAAGGGAK